MSNDTRVPSYRRHKQSGQAIVTLTDALTGRRRDVLLGRHGTKASKEEYRRVVLDWEANEPPPDRRGGRRRPDHYRTGPPLLATRRGILPPRRRHPHRRSAGHALRPPAAELPARPDRGPGLRPDRPQGRPRDHGEGLPAPEVRPAAGHLPHPDQCPAAPHPAHVQVGCRERTAARQPVPGPRAVHR